MKNRLATARLDTDPATEVLLQHIKNCTSSLFQKLFDTDQSTNNQLTPILPLYTLLGYNLQDPQKRHKHLFVFNTVTVIAKFV